MSREIQYHSVRVTNSIKAKKFHQSRKVSCVVLFPQLPGCFFVITSFLGGCRRVSRPAKPVLGSSFLLCRSHALQVVFSDSPNQTIVKSLLAPALKHPDLAEAKAFTKILAFYGDRVYLCSVFKIDSDLLEPASALAQVITRINSCLTHPKHCRSTSTPLSGYSSYGEACFYAEVN